MTFRRVLTALALSLTAFTGSALAQEPQHIVTPSALRQAIVGQHARDEATRDAVRRVLGRSDVRDVATKLGLDLQRAQQALPTLDSAELDRLAGPARAADAQLVGGDTVVISVTTLLLILILIVLIVD